ENAREDRIAVRVEIERIDVEFPEEPSGELRNPASGLRALRARHLCDPITTAEAASPDSPSSLNAHPGNSATLRAPQCPSLESPERVPSRGSARPSLPSARSASRSSLRVVATRRRRAEGATGAE